MKKLYDLIQNLSQAEKRHIKLRLTNNKDSSLLGTYYDILCKQKKYDFDQLLKEGAKPLKLTQSNLSLLYEIILKDLRYIVEEENVEIRLRSNISDIKTLIYKGFLDEAESRCLKLIAKAEMKEEFVVQREAYEELWDLNLKKGTIKKEDIEKIQNNIETIIVKVNTLTRLKNLYRTVTTHYYNFFFYNSTDRLTENILNIFQEVDQIKIDSTKAKFIYFEIKSIEYILKTDVARHHEIRKEQLLLNLSSNLNEVSKLSILLIISHLLTKPKIDGNIKELDAYMQLLENPFFDFTENQKDFVFLENYYDIYFLNQTFLQVFQPTENRTEKLNKLFLFINKHKLVTNEILLSRIHVGLIELKVLEEDYVGALHQLEVYFERFKKNKKSTQFIEAQLLEAIAIYLLDNFDIYIDKIEHIVRQVKTNKLQLNKDLQTMVDFLSSVSSSRKITKEEELAKIKHRQTYKFLIHKISDKISMNEIRQKYFQINDENYYAKQDKFLQQVEQLMKEQ